MTVVLLLLWVVVLGASGAVVFQLTRPAPRIGVTIVVGAVPRAVRVLEPATVGSALAEATSCRSRVACCRSSPTRCSIRP